MGLKFKRGNIKQKINDDNVEDITGYNQSQVLSFTGANSLGREINTIDISGFYPALDISVTTDDFSMQRVLNFESATVTNCTFELNDLKMCGGGIGTSVLVSQVKATGNAGFRKINLYAGRTKKLCNGYYTWGVTGFKMVGGSPAEFQQFIKMHFRKDANLAELLSTPKGKDFWRAKGFPWEGEFDLTAGSDCRNILDTYKMKWPWAKAA